MVPVYHREHLEVLIKMTLRMTITKVRGVTAKRVLCENFADTSWSRLVFSRGGY